MACKWMTIGIKLKEQDLVRRLQNSPEDDERKLTQIFMNWEESGRASWQLLIETLKSEGVKLGTVAKEILQGEEYCCGVFLMDPVFFYKSGLQFVLYTYLGKTKPKSCQVSTHIVTQLS